MKRKCAFCGKLRKVFIQSFEVDGNAFCSVECAWGYHAIKWIAKFTCVRCGAPIRMNAVVERSWNSLDPDKFYCCEKCMMDDLGLKLMEDEK